MTEPITRAGLDPDPETAYKQVAGWLDQHGQAVRRLTTLRDQILRELAGSERGGVARAARVAGVTHTQAGRLLADGLMRAVRAALEEGAGWTRRMYTVQAQGQAHPARVTLTLAGDGQPDGRWIARMNMAGDALAALRSAGLVASADGLTSDVNGEGPRHALAEGREITVAWARVFHPSPLT